MKRRIHPEDVLAVFFFLASMALAAALSPHEKSPPRLHEAPVAPIESAS